jgi:DNA-directed RNA polymerase specialized sigma24 family protein
VLDRSPGAVRVLLHRALRDLAARLERGRGESVSEL